ncbi:uncharacterized protein LOC129000413 [Macrosteles quadrilineatus]|uniref:uncharacterized protein LOC129000413 n=1 Tax=Macrosteles quadrilineatus TaxID=74068 RepID=UPI0023E2E197|nr:uncharacterized protein LOC129000413 [Macrosteles quadrilineatus]
MFTKLKQNEIGDANAYEYTESDQYKTHEDKPSFNFLSKIFSSKKPKLINGARNPFLRRFEPQPHSDPRETVFVEDDRDEALYHADFEDQEVCSKSDSRYNLMFIEGPTNKLSRQFMQGEPYAEYSNGQNTEQRRIGPHKSFLEVVSVTDRGTDLCDLLPERPLMLDMGTDPPEHRECALPSCENQKSHLNEELERKEKLVKSCLEEGNLLLDDLEKIKRHLSGSSKIPEIISSCLSVSVKKEDPADFLHLGRKCLMELGKHLLATQKQTEADMQTLKSELITVKKEKLDKEEKILSLKRKLDVQTNKVNHEEEDSAQLQSKVRKLQEALEAGKKTLKDTEALFKSKIDKLGLELSIEKEANHKLSKSLEEKTYLIKKLEDDMKEFQNSLESSKQHVKDIQASYKSKITKLEQDHANKMAVLCENQTLTNEQLSKALERSSNFVAQLEECKKESSVLSDANKSLQERLVALERDVTKAREQSIVAERRLARETQEVMALKSQVAKLEAMKEEELLSIDGDIWCQIMYQHDQWIIEDLRASLQDKESYLETLRSQGDCALRDFEKVQNELQQRRQQFNELKDVFLDFEKKRDSVVREQRDFYNKMMLLSKKTIPRDRFFKNLIEECQMKTNRIGEIEDMLRDTNQALDETKKISEAQLKAMQTEMQFTAERLYEFENQIRIKDMQLQEVVNVFEQEKKNKASAEEALNTYKILLDSSKKENEEVRSKLNYLEDMEKNRTNVQAAEDLAKETQKRKDTERKLKKLDKELVDLKNILQGKVEASTPHSDKSSLSSRDIEQLQSKVRELLENRKYMERILVESQRTKEQLQKDHEELYSKMRHAVRVMVESKRNQEELEQRLEQRGHTIQKLQRSQDETEDRLEELKDILHEMKKTIELLYRDREDLEDKLSNHMHCHAERAVHQELKSLQRDKAISEEQNSREREMLLHRIKDNESIIKDQHKHIRSLQDQLDNLTVQLRETKSALVTERHNHTQQLLSVQSEKKKQELYIQELEARLAYETRLRLKGSNTVLSTSHYVNTSDSYDPPIRDFNKNHPHRK